MEKFEDYGISISFGKKGGKVKTVCPKCSATRSHPNDRSLSVDLDKRVWHCHYCGWSGCLHEENRQMNRTAYMKPEPRPLSNIPPKESAWMVSRGISSATLKKAKVDVGREFMPQDGKEMNVIRFNFYRDGELVNTKYRTGNKHFKLISGAELPPYNVDAIKGTSECVITEGEMDCLSFIEAGRDDVVSVPNGAKSLAFLDEYMEEYFDGKETIFIASDNDAAGMEMRDELIRRFGAERCRLVTYGEGCKDANDHLVKFGAESLMERIEAAQFVKVSGIFDEADYDNDLDEVYMRGFQRGFTVGHPELDSLVSFETKRLCVVTGIPTCGKSEFVDEMLVRINLRYGYKAAFFSPENLPFHYHAIKLIEKATGYKFSINTMPYQVYETAKEYIGGNFFHIMPEGGSTLTNILSKAEVLVRRKGIKILVIDPYNRIDNEQPPGMNETQYISWQLDRMTEFAQRHDVLVILVAHPTKITRDNAEGGVPSLYNISGSAHFYNKADFGIIVHRESDNTLVRIQKVKFRHMGHKGDARFVYDMQNGRYNQWLPDSSEAVTLDRRNYLTDGLPDNLLLRKSDPFASAGDDEAPF